MVTSTLTLIGLSAAVANNDHVNAVLECWPQQERPAITTTTVDRVLVDDSILDSSGVVWIVLDQPNPPSLFQLIGCLQDRDLSAMLTQPHESKRLVTPFQGGIIIGPMQAGTESLCATLRTLWNQAVVIRSLKDEIHMLQAHHGGLCDRIDKMDSELRLAAKLQREFLPDTRLECQNVEFRVLYRPAGYVSGDIYDIMPLDHEHVGFFLADAAGHGVPAALMTMYIKRALQAKEEDEHLPNGYRIVPANEAIGRLNDDMVRQQTGKTGLATACYGVCNCRTLEVTIARAGHPFPMLLQADGSVETLEPEGMLLGVFPQNKYELTHCQLAAGDRLVLYSDGFEMAFPQNDEQDEGSPRSVANNQYLEEFKELALGTIDQAIQQLEHKLDQQIGSLNQRDDMTVLCLSVHGNRSAPSVDSNAA